jgi:hypothetical protein
MLYLPNANGGAVGPGARVLQLAALRESDPTHILFRRFTELASLSLDLEGNHLEQLGHDLRQMILTGEDGVNDFNDKFLGKLRRYCTTLVLVCVCQQYELTRSRSGWVQLEEGLGVRRTKPAIPGGHLVFCEAILGPRTRPPSKRLRP